MMYVDFVIVKKKIKKIIKQFKRWVEKGSTPVPNYLAGKSYERNNVRDDVVDK